MRLMVFNVVGIILAVIAYAFSLGGPVIWPTVAVAPTPRSCRAVGRCSSPVGPLPLSNTSQAAAQNTVETAEKCTTTASGATPWSSSAPSRT